MDRAPAALFEKKKTMEIGKKVSDLITKLKKQEVVVAGDKSVKEAMVTPGKVMKLVDKLDQKKEAKTREKERTRKMVVAGRGYWS